MKDIDTAPIVMKLRNDIYMKIINQVEMNLMQKISIVLYEDYEIDWFVGIQRQVVIFFKSSHEN
jgi:hypothetical protein